MNNSDYSCKPCSFFYSFLLRSFLLFFLFLTREESLSVVCIIDHTSGSSYSSSSPKLKALAFLWTKRGIFVFPFFFRFYYPLIFRVHRHYLNIYGNWSIIITTMIILVILWKLDFLSKCIKLLYYVNIVDS